MEKQKPIFYTELAYAAGLVLLALGTAFMTVADFGVSMVTAPAYILHLALSPSLKFLSFGMATYLFEGLLLLLMCVIIRRFRLSYLLSFVTAMLFGFLLDLALDVVSLIPATHTAVRIALFVGGVPVCALAVALMFRTYFSPEVYELFVKEIATRYRFSISRFKTVYDCSSFAIAVILSFCFFGRWQFRGIGVGTVLCALVNGFLIGLFGRLLDKIFRFGDGLPWRRFFER